jgi:hypothetical protein
MKISEPYQLSYLAIFAGLILIVVAGVPFRGALSLVEASIGLALIIFALVGLYLLPKRWL